MPKQDIIKSLRQQLNVSYTKPDPSRVDILINDLKNNQTALDYLKITRGFTDETIKHFKLGYSKDKDAISIPVFKNNELINIKYRLLNSKTIKYIQEKDCEIWLFNEEGIDESKKKGAVIITEGEFDCMSVWQSGIKSVVSPASGKDSYGVWIELIDNIPKAYICYDNDSAGKKSSKEMAERLGVDKSYEIQYPEGIKDANEYFKEHTPTNFKWLIKEARPFYKYVFKTLGDVIGNLRNPQNSKDILSSKFIPDVKLRKQFLLNIAARTGQGKSTYSLNIVDDLSAQGQSVLFLPLENGIDFVGQRLINILSGISDDEFPNTTDDQWSKVIRKIVDREIYFAMAKQDDIFETMLKAKRFFNTKIIVIDLIEELLKDSTENEVKAMDRLMYAFKSFAIDNDVIIMVVSHIKKDSAQGASIEKPPTLSDIRGSGSLINVPHCVVIINQEKDMMKVEVAKNKGKENTSYFSFDKDTGRLSSGQSEPDDPNLTKEENDLWGDK